MSATAALSRRESRVSPMSPLRNTFSLGALIFSKIEIFIKILYSLGIRFANSEFIPPKKNLKLSVRAAEPLIFAPPHPSRAERGEGMQFELFLKYTANTKMTNETVKIKIKNENNDSEISPDSDGVSWRIEEPDHLPKTTEWFWALGILALALIVFSILLKNYLLIIIVALTIFIIYSSKNKNLELVNFQLDSDGLYIERQFYSYDGFESFWIFPAQFEQQIERGSPRYAGRPAHNRELAFRYQRHLLPLLIVPFHNDDELAIRRILNKYLPESEEQESLIDLLRKRFF